MTPPLKLCIVGHTNTGKTSLVRTLTRDTSFGEVSSRPATTRHVEGAALLVNGLPLVELYDTPGLEDPIGLLEALDAQRGERGRDWIEVIREFLDGGDAHGRFSQEAKAIRQVLASDAALYVIDARDRVLAKNRDELEILGRCARPIIPVLNFIAGADARTAEWREHLGRVNMHVVAEFDTVVLDEFGEQRLYEKMRTLLDPFRSTLDALIAERATQRGGLVHAAAALVADMLLDAAAYTVIVSEQDVDRQGRRLEEMKQAVRAREQQCVTALLELFRFRPEDCEAADLPIVRGQWGTDLFSPTALRQFGLRLGSAAAAGGMAGLAVDAMTGGLSLGAAAVIGATLGALWGSVGSHGRRLADVFRGYTELRLQEETVKLLAARQIDLVQALLRRGHASQDRLRITAEAQAKLSAWVTQPLPQPLRDARHQPEWSRIGGAGGGGNGGSTGRADARDRLVEELLDVLRPAAAPGG